MDDCVYIAFGHIAYKVDYTYRVSGAVCFLFFFLLYCLVVYCLDVELMTVFAFAKEIMFYNDTRHSLLFVFFFYDGP